jgi:hypothetical protein
MDNLYIFEVGILILNFIFNLIGFIFFDNVLYDEVWSLTIAASRRM